MSGELSKDATDVVKIARELKVLDDASLRMLQQLFSNRLDQELVQQLVVGRERTLAVSLFKLMTATHAASTLGYVMRFTADLVSLCPTLMAEFTNAAECGGDAVQVFADVAAGNRGTRGIFDPALFLWASSLRQCHAQRETMVGSFLQVCSTVVSTGDIKALEFTVHAMCEFLRCAELRAAFLDAGLVAAIPRLLTLALAADPATTVQVTYEILLAARLLSFDYDCMAELHQHKIIPTAHRALQMATKEKVVRMSIYVLKNFIRAQNTYVTAHKGQEFVGTAILALARCNGGKGPNFFTDLIGVGVLKTAKQLQRKKYGDDDIATELDALVECLQAHVENVSSFAEYKGEVESGVLEWSPCHTSVKFWKENLTKFDANQFEIVRHLAALLNSPASSEITLAVACHDIGELVRHHPSGRELLDLEELKNVKARIMALMSHECPDVAKQALTAVQKILVDRF